MAKSTGPNWTVLVIDGRTVPQFWTGTDFGTCTLYGYSVRIFIGEVRGTDLVRALTSYGTQYEFWYEQIRIGFYFGTVRDTEQNFEKLKK